MLVCPSCRTSNPEQNDVCVSCGAKLEATTALGRRRSTPVEIDIPPRVQGPRWPRIVAFGAILAVAVGAGVWLLVKPSPCDGKFTSSQFDYCVQTPPGWEASVARVGSTEVDQFAGNGARAFVLSAQFRPGATLASFATLAQRQARREGLEAGDPHATVVAGRAALEWNLTDPNHPAFRGLQVVTFFDDTGWTVQLDDVATTYDDNVSRFRSMLRTIHFR